jgi:hypothetical protein
MFRFRATQQLCAILAMFMLLALPSRVAAQADAGTSATSRTPPIERLWLQALPTQSRRLPASPGRSEIFKVDRSTFNTNNPIARTSLLQDVRRRDSLANGILIGGAVGAAALGTFGAILCKAMQAPGEPSCVDDTFRLAAIGGAIGAGGGLIVDAALDRQSGVSVAVGFKF